MEGGGGVPLPVSNIAWPPPACVEADRHYRVWGAWYSGDPDQLQRVYQVTNGIGAAVDQKYGVAASNVTLLNQTSRYFWGNPATPGETRNTKLHVPLAADISSTSSDLLFGEPPAFSVDDDLEDATADALEKLVGGGLVPVLSEGAEIGSSMGGYYIRVSWDPAVADHPIYDTIPPDSAIPIWRSGRLVAVTFWREVAADDTEHVYRHLELHEPGKVWHGLYRGDTGSLGVNVPFDRSPETQAFSALVNSEGWVDTGTTWLTAEYVPNMLPNRIMRGSLLGRSDYSGIESTMDAIDETWSSLMRDVRNGKGRVIVPESYLDSQGPGRGARFDPERGYFSPVKALPDSEGVSLEIVQFDIRVTEHVDTIRALSAQAVRGAGYSAQTFGESDSSSGTATATEIQARERRSYTTRDKKIGYTKPPLGRILKAGLEMYAAKFGFEGITPVVPDIVFPDGVQTDEFTTARTIQMLDSAKAISTRTKVEMAHSQWSKTQVDEEVEAIEGQEPEAADDLGDGSDRFEDDPDPANFGMTLPEVTGSARITG